MSSCDGKVTVQPPCSRGLRPLAGLVLALLVFPAHLFAESRTMRFERLSVEQGLSQSTVNCILQDRRGFLWLGTQDGLNRYDGYSFKVYKTDPEDPTSLAHNWITALAEDPSGDLWIGTEGGGLSRWQHATDSFLHFAHDPKETQSLSGDMVRVLTLDSVGTLWIGTVESGLNRFDARAGSFRQYRHDPAVPASLSDDQVGAVHVDREGNLWVGTWNGLNLLAKTTLDYGAETFTHFRHDATNPRSLSDNRVRAILEDSSGNLWLGTHAGLNRFEPATGNFVRYLHSPGVSGSLSHNWVRSLLEDEDGRLWIGTDGGLNLWQRESGSFASYHSLPGVPTSLGSDQLVDLYQDLSGLLWVGTLGGGVSKWNPRSWSFPHYRDDSSDVDGRSNNVFALTEDPQGMLWVGTFGGGVERLDRSNGERDRYTHAPGDESSLSDDRVTTLLNDRVGLLWVGTLAGGLNRLDATTGTFERFVHDPAETTSLSADAVTTLYEDRQGELWIGTYGGGLNRHRGKGTFERFQHDPADPKSLSNDRVFSMAEDNAGRLWLATDGGGLNRFDRANQSAETFLRVRHLAPADSLSSDELTAVHVDPAGELWVGTKGNGLDKLEVLDQESGQATFKNYSMEAGLPNKTIWGIQSETQGVLWLSTNGGLVRFDPRTETFKAYNISHGLQSNEFNLGAHFMSRNGELFFGGVNGFNAFFPGQVRSNTKVPKMVLTGFSRLNEQIEFDRPLFAIRELALDYRDRLFSFEFAALDYTAPGQNQYRYRLEGFDEGWIGLGNQRRLTFTSLAPGDYALRVQGSNNDGVWNEEGISVAISIKPPFWKTWWFQLLGAASLVSLVAFISRERAIRVSNERLQMLVRDRTRELEEAQDQLVRREKLAVLGELAGSVAHELRNPLAVIKNSIFFLRLTLQSANEKVKEHLGLIDRKLEVSNRIITELLNWGHDPQPELERVALQKVIEEELADLGIPRQVCVERDFGAEPIVVEADPGQIGRVVGNLLRNAIQAMPEGGTLGVGCQHQNGEATVTVSDTGVGIAAENLTKIFEPLFTSKAKGIGLGLPVSQRYARANQGRIECESEFGQGATFRLVLAAVTKEPVAGRSEGTP